MQTICIRFVGRAHAHIAVVRDRTEVEEKFVCLHVGGSISNRSFANVLWLKMKYVI